MLTPKRSHNDSGSWYWEVPQDPKAVLLMLHGCGESAYDLWPRSDACPECRGMPEELAMTKQALARGYAVLAVNSQDRDESRCWRCAAATRGVCAGRRRVRAERAARSCVSRRPTPPAFAPTSSRC